VALSPLGRRSLRPSPEAEDSVQALGRCGFQDCQALSQHLGFPQPGAEASLATRTLPLLGCREDTQAGIGQSQTSSPWVFLRMALPGEALGVGG
jgi:hypothetical protein